MLVKLSPAQHLLYRHLLVKLARKDLIAMTAEAQKHDQLAAASGTTAAEAGDGDGDGDAEGGDGQAPSQVSPEGEGGSGVEDSNGGGKKAATATAEGGANASASKMDESHYQKLSTLLLQLRYVDRGTLLWSTLYGIPISISCLTPPHPIPHL